jgi:hypothetical protein
LAGLLTSPGSERLRWIDDLRGNFAPVRTSAVCGRVKRAWSLDIGKNGE